MTVTQNSWGVSFLSFDARSIAMGGTGVVTARSHNASLFNPALLTHQPNHAAVGYDSTLQAHAYVGARLADRNNFIRTAEDFEEKYQGQSLDDLLRDSLVLERGRSPDSTGLRSASEQIQTLQYDINQLSNRPLRASASYGLSFRYPVNRWAFGGYHRHYTVLGSVVDIAERDNAQIDRVRRMIDTVATLVEEVAALNDIDVGDLTANEAIERADPLLRSARALDELVDFERLQQDVIAQATRGRRAQDYLREPLSRDFASTIESAGAEVAELGLSIARSFNGHWHLGATLKQVDFTTVRFSQPLNAFSLSAYQLEQYRRDHRQKFNADIGVIYDFASPWQMGLAVRNLISYNFANVTGEVIPLRPVARLGVGYIKRGWRLSLDTDLTRNEPLGFDPDKQYASVGAEWYMWRNTAVRAGVRTNLVDGETLPSIGFGLGGRHGHLDMAVARSFNGDEWGLALQGGLAF